LKTGVLGCRAVFVMLLNLQWSVILCFCFFAVLWNTYGDCDNIAVMKGHSGAIMDLHFSTDGRFVC